MIYIEYIERDRFMDVEIFRVLGDQSWWEEADEEGDDELVAQLGRTLRLGPHPFYMTLWRCRGFDKLDEWEAHFNSDAARRDTLAKASHKAIHLCDAGCYDELLTGPEIDSDLQYVEYFKAPDGADDMITGAFKKRAEKHTGGTLNLVLHRIGRLGPDPGGMAVWTFPNYDALSPIVRDMTVHQDIEIRSMGVYRGWGREIL